MRWLSRFAFGFMLLSLLAADANAEKRIALVIGNGAYKNVPKLPNPPNDAADVAAALRRSGFDVIFETNLDQIGMQDASIRFAREARTADGDCFITVGTPCNLQVSIISCLLMPVFEMRRISDAWRGQIRFSPICNKQRI